MPPLLYIELHIPLEYDAMPELKPFEQGYPDSESAGEMLFCFELDAAQALRIDPEANSFPGKLVSAGRRLVAGSNEQEKVVLPAGHYVFVQHRAALNREECVFLAIEQQKDGLWERHKLDNRLYLRFLYEDGSPVTQLFRPC